MLQKQLSVAWLYGYDAERPVLVEKAQPKR
jgi:hypothetical protein